MFRGRVEPLLPHELTGLQAQPFLIVEPGEQMTGFNLSKGHTQSLTFTRVRPNGDCRSAAGANSFYRFF